MSCGSVTIKNTRWWGVEGILGATSFDTLDTASFHIEQPAWLTQSVGYICGSAAAFSELKREIQVFCNQPGKCDEQTTPVITSTINRIEAFIARQQRIQNSLLMESDYEKTSQIETN